MIIHYLGGKSFLVKTKLSEIITGDQAEIGDIGLSGPGEYEVADVQVKGFKDAYLFSTEGLNILYVDNPAGLPEETAKKIEEDIDVLLMAVDNEATHLKGAVKTMNDIDPKVALPGVATAEHPFCKEVGGCPPPSAELKIANKDLAEGERKVVILNARSQTRRRTH